MIRIPISKILFIDIETVGGCYNYDQCLEFNPSLAKQFENYELCLSKKSWTCS